MNTRHIKTTNTNTNNNSHRTRCNAKTEIKIEQAEYMAINGKLSRVSKSQVDAAKAALVADFAEGLIDLETLEVWCVELVVCDAAEILSDACVARFFVE